MNILDYGCGYGQTLRALRDVGFKNITGYDIDYDAIKHCRLSLLNIIDGNECLISESEELFDLIIAAHVLEHVEKENVMHLLSSLRKRLNPGGCLFIAVPNAQSNTGCYWMYEDFTHKTLYTAGSIIFVLKRAGFSSVEIVDSDCTADTKSFCKKNVKKFLLKLYALNYKFWNKVTGSSFHEPSPIVFSYEIKVVARV